MPTCAKDGCCRRTAIIVGSCKACSKDYCLNHRLYEDHACPKLEEHNQQAKEIQRNRLMEDARFAKRPRVESI
jgi:predicted nucleic acid binding AN1-type Zn finger protein